MTEPKGVVVAKCPKCFAPIRDDHPYTWCSKCSKKLPEDIKALIPAFSKHINEKKEADERITKIIVTTAPMLEGFRVVKTLDIITSECVSGVNIFNDILTSLSDVFGGRSGTAQKTLREARQTCIYELKREAASIGADAVIAVDLDYSEISGGGKSMLFLVASGTAVKIEPISTNGLESPMDAAPNNSLNRSAS